MVVESICHVGQEIAAGRYRIIEALGEGSMGQVYRAEDRRLDTDVVIKFPMPDAANGGAELLKRFEQEFRSLVKLSHPHIVKLLDVGEHDRIPYVVMQYLAGGSLKGLTRNGPDQGVRALPPATLKNWLPSVAKALDFIHGQNHVHRDVKPANILFDQHGHAFLADLGLTKSTRGAKAGEAGLTAAGYVLGTPNYLAPEVIMGQPFGPRCDQYALAMTVHEVLVGHNVMEGPTASATLVNQTKIQPVAPGQLIRGIPSGLSHAVLRGLEKNPEKRFDSCVDLARAVLNQLGGSGATRLAGSAGRAGVPAAVPASSDAPLCPKCHARLPITRKHVGKSGRCSRCGTSGVIELSPEGVLRFQVAVQEGAKPSTRPVGPRATTQLSRPEKTSVVRELPTRERPEPAPERVPQRASADDRPRRKKSEQAEAKSRRAMLTGVGMGLVAAIGGMAVLFWPSDPGEDPRFTPVTKRVETGRDAETALLLEGTVEVNLAASPEKEDWLRAAVNGFQGSPLGQRIRINIVPMGSLQGAQAILDGPNPLPIHGWSPSANVYGRLFEDQWRVKRDSLLSPTPPPIARAEELALSPLVFVIWKDRYELFVGKYQAVTIESIARAIAEPEGWGALAGRPEWGRFKFGHANPETSSSGLMLLSLAAYANAGKGRDLTAADITSAPFQTWLSQFEAGVTRASALSLADSPSDQLRDMLKYGPSQYDALAVPENLAIEALKQADPRGRAVQVVYPDPGLWNQNPLYVLDVPWSDAKQREALSSFLDYLLSEPAQQLAVERGFRPANTAVGLSDPASPFVIYQTNGISVDTPSLCEPLSPAVLKELLGSYRTHAR